MGEKTKTRKRVQKAEEVKEKHEGRLRHLPSLQEARDHFAHAVEEELKVIREKAEDFEHVVMDEIKHVKEEIKLAKEKAMKYIGSIEEVPIFLRFNEYIHGGYRIQFQHYGDVFTSMFTLHNETVNIWSHFVGFILMVFLFFDTLVTFDFVHVSDLFMFSLFFLGSCAMFLLSTLYHLFNCIEDKKVYDNLMMCDYIGIFSMIFGSCISAFHFAFHCFWIPRTIYQSVITFFCLCGIVLVVTPKFTHEKYHTFKVLFYIATVAFAALPVAHIAVAFGIYDTTRWWVLLFLYAAGVAVYASKFPECKFPGKFDFWLSSHQLWHFFILGAGLWHYYSIVTMYQERVKQGCHV